MYRGASPWRLNPQDPPSIIRTRDRPAQRQAFSFYPLIAFSCQPEASPLPRISSFSFTTSAVIARAEPSLDKSIPVTEFFPVRREAISSGCVRFVAGFPPCTDVAVSGTPHFAAKAGKDKFFQAKAALIAEQCRVIGQLAGAPWFFENPVRRPSDWVERAA